MILNYGSLNIDHVYRVDHFVRPGETLSSTVYEVFGGGKGANQSVAITRAGAKVVHAGKLGQDGAWLKRKLASSGVDVTHIELTDGPSGHAIIQVVPSGENSIVLYGGVNQQIDEHHIESVFRDAHNYDTVLLQNEISGTDYIMRRAAKLGLRIILNPAPMSPQVLGYPLELVNVFILNEVEATALSGESAPTQSLEALRKRFSRSGIILTLGAQGVMYGDAAGVFSVPAKKAGAVDTTAAGDTFIGYFLAGLTQGSSTRASLELACNAAAICVTRHGAMDSIPLYSEVDSAVFGE